LEVSRVNTPYSSSEPNKSVVVNRQCGDGKFKYVPKFCIGSTGHVISRMRNDDMHRTGTLEPNISKTLSEIEAWSQWSINREWGTGSRMVTWPMTSRDLERSRSRPNYL